MSTVPASVPPPPAKLHDYHQHGDIEFRSRDGMILMADSWRIAKASKVFADMLEISTAKHGGTTVPTKRKHTDQSRPIEIDYSSSVISHFIDLANQARPSPPEASYEDAKLLYEFCEQFDLNHWIRSVIKDRLGQVALVEDRYGHPVERNQWDLLMFAGGRNDIELGRKALAKMDTLTFCMAGESKATMILEQVNNYAFWGKLRSLPDHWQADLLYRILKGPFKPMGHGEWILEIMEDGWDSMAESEWDPKHESPY